jgi:MSHA biogenesis protein MshN
MSVINQALRDLEKRGAIDRPDRPTFSAKVVSPPRQARFSVLAFSLIVAVLLSAAGYWLWLSTISPKLMPIVSLSSTEERPARPVGASGQSPNQSHGQVNQEPMASQRNEQADVVAELAVPSSIPVMSTPHKTSLAQTHKAKPVIANAQVTRLKPAAEASKPIEPARSVASNAPSQASTASERPVIIVANPVVADQVNEVVTSKNNDAESPSVSVSAQRVTVSPASRDSEHAAMAQALINKGALVPARTTLQQFIDNHDVHTESKVTLAKLLVAQGDDAAIARLIAAQQDWSHRGLRMVAARYYFGMAEYSRARQMLERTLPDIETSPHYFALLASVYQKEGQYVRQADLYQQLIAAHGDHAKWWLGTAIAWDQLKQYKQARRAYEKTKELNLRDPQLLAFANQRAQQLRAY